ncbi:DUF3006 domain-containing protein [Clostridium magnum]|uniref:DUF3006 domain-containing protein n=1 Tax=Clostridium magnum DSM 2767 TaxID=1121326 RepID=A0A162TTL3_9CLOT|nr:DUF3006 domain-containing protein [Clostridium magnum]KZL93047.1 hypothetical protein CLMAG_00390 [Clostridium magnum DSM 2767]SHJ19924.1 Protein of unknown function [Clostridium magnum DSM 2767]
MLGIIDRFEDEFAIIELENKKIINIEKSKIPTEAIVGDVLNIGEYITINLVETESRRKRIERLSEDLWK